MDFSIIQKLANEEPYKSSRNEYQINFAPKTVQIDQGRGLGDPHQGGDAAFLSELLGPAQDDHRA